MGHFSKDWPTFALPNVPRRAEHIATQRPVAASLLKSSSVCGLTSATRRAKWPYSSFRGKPRRCLYHGCRAKGFRWSLTGHTKVVALFMRESDVAEFGSDLTQGLLFTTAMDWSRDVHLREWVKRSEAGQIYGPTFRP